jgi:hypothetical protein
MRHDVTVAPSRAHNVSADCGASSTESSSAVRSSRPRIYKHPHSQELRVFAATKLTAICCTRSLARFRLHTREEKASRLREVLLEKAWTALSNGPENGTSE